MKRLLFGTGLIATLGLTSILIVAASALNKPLPAACRPHLPTVPENKFFFPSHAPGSVASQQPVATNSSALVP